MTGKTANQTLNFFSVRGGHFDLTEPRTAVYTIISLILKTRISGLFPQTENRVFGAFLPRWNQDCNFWSVFCPDPCLRHSRAQKKFPRPPPQALQSTHFCPNPYLSSSGNSYSPYPPDYTPKTVNLPSYNDIICKYTVSLIFAHVVAFHHTLRVSSPTHRSE
jgi:hypothetical protein